MLANFGYFESGQEPCGCSKTASSAAAMQAARLSALAASTMAQAHLGLQSNQSLQLLHSMYWHLPSLAISERLLTKPVPDVTDGSKLTAYLASDLTELLHTIMRHISQQQSAVTNPLLPLSCCLVTNTIIL